VVVGGTLSKGCNMNKIAILAATFSLFAIPALALDCTVPSEDQLSRHECYTNKKGHQVHVPSKTERGVAPTGEAVPAGAVARCQDGSYSFSEHRRDQSGSPANDVGTDGSGRT